MRIRNAAIVGVLMVGVAACDASAPAQKDVKGDRDDVRKVAATKEVSHKKKVTTKTCTRKVNGKCKSYRTSTSWKKVVDKQAKPALYCVELDNVNGSSKDDDVWYTTSAVTYLKAVGLAEGDQMKFRPVHGGCW